MTTPLGNLRRKRIRIHRQLDELEPLLAAYHITLAPVDAQIPALAPELPLPTRHRTYRPNPHFMRGELPRVALAILREAGEPLPIRVIAARALAQKDCRAPTRRIFKMTRVRLQQLFGRLERKGLTYSVGERDAAGVSAVDVDQSTGWASVILTADERTGSSTWPAGATFRTV